MAMSMRQRRGENTIYRPQRSFRPPSYETFKPNSELIEQDMSTILRLGLQGFVEDQIKVDYDESTRLIRISGERPILNRRRLRFNEQFRAPKDYNPREMKTQFDQGFFTITIPKLDIGAKENPKETVLEEAIEEPMPPKGHDDIQPKETVLEEAIEEPIPPKGHDDIQPKTVSETNNEHQKVEEKIEAVISERSREAKNVVEDKEDEIGEKTKESKTSVALPEKEETEKKESDTNLETETAGDGHEEKIVKAVVPNIEQNEQKQTLINIGVATLVIMAVGAQVYHTMTSFNSPS